MVDVTISARKTLAAGAAIAAFTLLAAAGCDKKPGVAADPTASPECVDFRGHVDHAKQAIRTANKQLPPDAPLEALVKNTEDLAKASKEVADDFAKTTPKRQDLADAATGISMLGGLANQKLVIFAETLRVFAGRVTTLQKLDAAAVDAMRGIDPNAAAAIGCADKSAPKAPPPGADAGAPEAPKPPPSGPCGPVVALLQELVKPPMPTGFADAAKIARGHADALETLAKDIEALPASPADKKAREDLAKRARDASVLVRATVQPLEETVPVEDHLPKDRQGAQEAAMRMAVEVESASKICAIPGTGASASASAGAPPKGPKPPAPGAPSATGLQFVPAPPPPPEH